MSKVNISDPKIFGPVLWSSIHNMAMKLSEECFMAYIKETLAKIPCMNCRKHSLEYLNLHPLEEFKGIKDPVSGEVIGMFKWSWIFHNSVNQRIGNKVLDWDTAYNMYTDVPQVCSLQCGN